MISSGIRSVRCGPALMTKLVSTAGFFREELRSRRSVVLEGNLDTSRFGGFIELQKGTDQTINFGVPLG